MPTDYTSIREENIREYGQGTRHLSFLGRLYTDRTHFVLELLQNAEDAGATKIRFNLYSDRLEVKHDGRSFNERDVRGVCGVGEGTKNDDLTQIGKFGIGFKSVYAYTATPKIFSGEEAFKIDHFVRPSALPPKSLDDGYTTLFVFPFNNQHVSKDTACNEIGERLRKLNARTLLFLRSIKRIEYKLQRLKMEFYHREESSRKHGRHVRVIGPSNGTSQLEDWLIFERKVQVPDSTDTVSVEICFRLKSDINTQGKPSERIARVTESPLFVSFPTEKATRFGFLIQGPYRTTPSRDNIPKNDDWNKTLIKETARLMEEVPSYVKAMGLLTVSFLDSLPIRMEDFPEEGMFFPIAEAVRRTLYSKELLPAQDGSYVSAQNAIIPRGSELRTLLSDHQLTQLLNSTSEMKWLIQGINRTQTPVLRDYLLNQLEVREVTPDVFADLLHVDFLNLQSDEWFISFYGYLSKQEALWRAPTQRSRQIAILRSKPIIRLNDGTHAEPFESDGITPNVYLPPPEETTFPIANRFITSDEQAANFLDRLGLSEPDVFDEIIELVLPAYESPLREFISEDQHKDDILKILRAMSSDSEKGKTKVINAATETTFLRASNSHGATAFKSPSEIYFDTENLRTYFSTSTDIWFLHGRYAVNDDQKDVWRLIGVSDRPRILQTSEGLPEGVAEYSTRKTIVENMDMEGLALFLELIEKTEGFENKKDYSTLLWKILSDYSESDKNIFKGRYKWYYYLWQGKSFESMIYLRLQEASWLPTQNGKMKQPREVTTDMLDRYYLTSSRLIESLGISTSDKQREHERKHKYAEELGVTLDLIELLKKHPEEIKQLSKSLAEKQKRISFPSRPLPNPERREKRIKEIMLGMPEKDYEKRTRRVRINQNKIDPITWLRLMYTNEDDQLVCQICTDEMPFRKRDGHYYFEKKEVLTRAHLPKESEAQFIALCPLCAAKFQEFILLDSDAVSQLKEKILSSEDGTVPIKLGEEDSSIRFVETHHADLKVLLRNYEKQED